MDGWMERIAKYINWNKRSPVAMSHSGPDLNGSVLGILNTLDNNDLKKRTTEMRHRLKF